MRKVKSVNTGQIENNFEIWLFKRFRNVKAKLIIQSF